MEKHTKILLVDDHGIIRQGVKMILESETGLQVIGEAADANEAMAKAIELQPDVIVMDIHLAGADGIEASGRILTVLPNVKIIVLSAETTPDVVNRALQSGISGYVIKEAAGDEVIRAIHTVMTGRFYLCPAITTALVRANNFNTPPPAALSLTNREKEVLYFVASGLRNKEIAEKLGLSIKSIEANRSRLMTKLGCGSAAELVRYAVREGIAEL